MEFYANAWETELSAIDLFNAGRYRHSISLACLAVGLYLKSKLHLVSHRVDLEKSHDVIGLYDALCSHYQPKVNMRSMINICRKYFNESRYPYDGDTSVYTQAFAKEFIDFVVDIRQFIDNECMATIDDLAAKYSDR